MATTERCPPEIRRVYTKCSLNTKLSVFLGNLAGKIDLRLLSALRLRSFLNGAQTVTLLRIMNEIVALFAGVGLAAACGFRVFVPLFITSLAASGNLEIFGEVDVQALLGEQEWLGNPWVTLALGIATALEIGSYYIPWLDSALDTVATPAAVVAGTFITGTMMPDMMGDGSFKWIAATIAGGGTAGLIQGASVITRVTSTATTGGIGNPVMSTAELGGSILTAGLSLLMPILAGLLVLILMYFVIRTIVHFFKNRSQMPKIDGAAG
ncbi:MAG: hypothetical protein ACI9FZ_001434 [Bacteroidia bacterium]